MKPVAPDSTARALSVYFDDALAGQLLCLPGRPSQFTYEAAWLDSAQARSISPILPLQRSAHEGDAVDTFFENLLPEGRERELLEKRFQTSDVFELLACAGRDLAGAVSVVPQGASLTRGARTKRLTWEAIAAYFGGEPADDAADMKRRTVADALGLRPSVISGAQRKLLIALDADGAPVIPQGTPTTHLVKPDIAGVSGVWRSALNEALVMRLAAAIGLPVAESFYEPQARALVVKRFDRVEGEQRLHAIDFAQLAGVLSTQKYENDGGPGVKAIFELIDRYSSRPLQDRAAALRWIAFNLAVCNYDGHAKNIALIWGAADGTARPMQLAPFYDLMCTGVYAGLAHTFAFRLGGENRPGQLGPEHFSALATEVGVRARTLFDLLAREWSRVRQEIDAVAETLQAAVPANDRVVVDRVAKKVRSESGRLLRRLAGDAPPSARLSSRKAKTRDRSKHQG